MSPIGRLLSRSGARLTALLLTWVLLAACRVDATVDVRVEEDGSGVVAVDVVLDADAVARVPDLATSLRTEDLTAAGWTVAPPAVDADGAVTVHAEKPFATPEQLPSVLAEISTAFEEMTLERSRSFGQVHWTLDGRIDVTGGAEQFGDDQLATLLGGQPLGRDLATLEQEIGSTVAEATSLRFTASLPGDEDGEWTVGLDDPSPTQVRLQGTVERTSVRLLAVVAAAAAGAFLLVLVVAVLRWRARRRGRRPDLWNDAPDEPFAPAVTPMPASAPPRRRQLQLVVTEAHGVLWESRVTAEEWLVNLVAMQGGTATRDEVGAVLREALVGRIRSRDIWRALGVPGETPHLDAAYVARFSLTPGVEDLVTALARRGIGLACLTNDVYEWSVLLRDRFGLDRSITPWIVSSDIGAAKPAAAMFDAVAAEAHLPLEHCLYLDDNLENLNAAKQLGMSTVLVAPRPGEARALGHGHVVTVRDLLRRRPGSVPT